MIQNIHMAHALCNTNLALQTSYKDLKYSYLTMAYAGEIVFLPSFLFFLDSSVTVRDILTETVSQLKGNRRF